MWRKVLTLRRALFYVIGAMVLAVVSEFAIEYAKARGAYDNPTDKVDTAVNILTPIVNNWWFAVALGATGGMLTSLWLVEKYGPRQALAAGDSVSAAAIAPQDRRRRLTASQKAAITNYIKSASPEPRGVTVFHENASEECVRYAVDLAEAIALSGTWTSFASSNVLGKSGTIKDLKIGVQNVDALNTDARILAEALKQAGVRFDYWPTPPMKPDGLHLYVGFQDDD